MKNVLLIYGGGGNEHEVSVVSKDFLAQCLGEIAQVQIFEIEITKNSWLYQDKPVTLTTEGLTDHQGQLITKAHFVVPCVHGFPGETGELPGLLEMLKVPYLGNNAEKSNLCFNKLTTKFWLEKLDLPVTPYLFLTDSKNIDEKQLDQFWETHLNVFVKASSEGSSVGCYPVTKKSQLRDAVEKAFQFSEQIIVEKFIYGRELEVACYQIEGELFTTHPGEIICPQDFYSYEQKYDKGSSTKTQINALNLSEEIVLRIDEYSQKAFRQLGLRHLARIDFLYDKEGELYINEINTFPGMTSISLFPQMLNKNGHRFSDYLAQFL